MRSYLSLDIIIWLIFHYHFFKYSNIVGAIVTWILQNLIIAIPVIIAVACCLLFGCTAILRKRKFHPAVKEMMPQTLSPEEKDQMAVMAVLEAESEAAENDEVHDNLENSKKRRQSRNHRRSSETSQIMKSSSIQGSNSQSKEGRRLSQIPTEDIYEQPFGGNSLQSGYPTSNNSSKLVSSTSFSNRGLLSQSYQSAPPQQGWDPSDPYADGKSRISVQSNRY